MMTNFPSPPVVLTIAGSDNSAGAGIQADLKTFFHLQVYGLTALTCVVAEVPGKVTAVQAIEAEIVEEQIRLCLAHYPVQAVKTGMLYSREIIEIVARFFEGNGHFLVVDPVMVASSGDPLLQKDAVSAYEALLFPRAALVTPNLDETAVLLGGRAVTNLSDMESAGRELSTKFGVPFLIKGGHLAGDRAIDLLVDRGESTLFESPFLPGLQTHGTGCTYSAAIAAGLAQKLTLTDAVGQAKKYIQEALRQSFSWESKNGRTMALNHSL